MIRARAGARRGCRAVRRDLVALAANLLMLCGLAASSGASDLAGQAPPDTVDLRITKTGTTSANAGDTLRYTLTVANNGPGTARDVFVADTLPAGSRFVSASGGGAATGRVVRWPTVAGLGPSDPDLVLTLVLIAPGFTDNAPITVTNVATVATSSFDTDPSNDVSRHRTVVEGSAPDLQIVKSAPDSVGGTDLFTYTITVSNAGPAGATNVVVTDSLPSRGSVVAISGGGVPAGGVITWPTVSVFPANAPALIHTVTYRAPAAPDTLTNVAVVTTSSPDRNEANNRSSVDTRVLDPTPPLLADVRVTKSAPDSVGVGDAFTYFVSVSNAGPDPATNVVVIDTLPDAGIVLAISGGGVRSGRAITWPAIATLAPGDPAVVYTVTYRAPTAPDTLLNLADATSSTPDPDLSNNRAEVRTRVVDTPPPTVADLSIVKSGPDSVGSEDFFRYALLVRNHGPATAVNVVIRDVLPVAGRFIGASNGGSRSGRTVTWPTIPSMAPGASVSYWIDYQAPTGPVTLRNTGIVSSSTPDPVPENDTSSVSTRVPGAPATLDVAIEKSGPTTVAGGTTFDYGLVVTNVGSAVATNVQVSDTLPPAGAFVAASGTFSESAGVVTWAPIPSLAVGASQGFTVTYQAPAGGTFTNRAVVTTPGDTNALNDTSSVVTTVPPGTDVSIEKTGPAVRRVGENGTFTITVTNRGPEEATGVVVTDTLPPPERVVFLTSSPAASASPPGAPRVLKWPTIPTMAPGETRVYTVTLNFPTIGTHKNVAAVSTTSPDDDPTNNVDSTTTVVDGVEPEFLGVEKQASRTEASIGDVVDYRLTVEASRIPDVRVVDVLPRGFRYVTGSARIDGSTAFEPVESPRGTLTYPAYAVPPSPNTRTITYRVLIGADAVLGDGVNRVTVKSDSTGTIDHDSARVIVRETPFDDEGIIVGKVYLDCGCDAPLEQEEGEVGIPGVRVYLQDGSSVVTDSEGKYDFYGLSPRTWVVKVDRSTLPLPDSARLIPLTNRHGNDGATVFVDLKRGELHRADFADRSGSSAVRRRVEERRVRARERGLLLDPLLTSTMPADQVRADTPFQEFRPLLPDFTLNDRNAGLPRAPGALEVAAGGGLAERAAQPLSQPESDAIAIAIDGGYRADGVTPVPVTVTLPGATSPAVVTLEATAGRWVSPDPAEPTGTAELDDRDPVAPGLQVQVRPAGTEFRLIAPTVPGPVEVRVSLDQARTRSERVVFAPMLRSLMAVGLLEARLDLRSLTNGELGLRRDRFEDALRSFQTESEDGDVTAGARAALFLKGGIHLSGDETPDAELTLRLDSEEDERSRLFRDIRPDQFYPVYGDASPREFDAQSKGRFFGQLQKGASFLRYGDFNTGLESFGQTGARALGQYSRTLNGAFEHFENERIQVDAFASRDRFRQVVDEIPGQGISGPYALSRSDGLVGSERVELVTRDRNQPAVVLRSEVLERFTDYTIEPLTGRIVFRRPIPSQDSEFNPVAIRVSYEVETGGDRFWVFGANGQFRPTDRVEIGGGFVRDDNPLSRFDLASVNATIEVLSGTYLVGEFATTDSASVHGGDAGRLELRHSSEYVDARAFYLATDRAFGNASSAFARGREELGFRGVARLPGGRTQLFGEYLRTENRFTSGRRKGGRVALERAFGAWVRAQLGIRFAEETLAPATSQTGVEPDAVNAIGARITAGLPFLPDGSIFGEFEQDVSDSDQRRAVIGADYRVLDRARIYGRHELISSLSGPYGMHPDLERNTTVFGIAADYLAGQSIFSEYRARDAFQGRDAQAAIGLRNAWSIDEGVRLSTSLERVAPLAAGSRAATAVTGALEFTQDPLWKATLRAEYYARDGADNFFGSAGYARKLSQDWTFLGNSVFSTMIDGDRSFERTRLGLAYRQTERNRWSALGRYEHRWDENQDPEDFRGTRSAHVFSTHLNYQPDPELILRAQWASKFASAESEALSTSESAHLLGARGTLDVTRALDLGVIGRTLFAGSFERSQFGLGLEAGLLLADNLRLAAGYNVFGFRDDEFSEDEYTDRGFYVQLGFKFDEALFGWGRADRGLPDSVDCGCDLVLLPDLHVRVEGPAMVRQDSVVVYTITVENLGEGAADTVRLDASLTFDPGVDLRVVRVSDSSTVVDLGTLATGRIQWLLPDPVLPGARVTRQVSFRATCESAVSNFVLAGDVSTVTPEESTGDESFSIQPSVTEGDCHVDAGLAWLATPTATTEGEPVDVTLTTSSLGTMTARGVELRAVIPATGVEAVTILDGGVRDGDREVVWRFGDLAPADARVVRVRLVPACRGADSAWTITARVSTDSDDINPSNDDIAGTVRVAANPSCVPTPNDLRATIEGPGVAAEGSRVTYVVGGQPRGRVSNVTLSATIPSEAIDVATTPTAPVVGGSIDWGVVASSLGVGDSSTATVTFTVPTCDVLGGSSFTVSVFTDTDTPEPKPNNRAARSVTVTGITCPQSETDLAISVSDPLGIPPDTAWTDAILSFLVTTENVSSVTAENVAVTAWLRDGLTLVRRTIGSGRTPVLDGDSVVWETLPSIPGGGWQIDTLLVRLPRDTTSAPRSFRIDVATSTSTPETILANNRAGSFTEPVLTRDPPPVDTTELALRLRGRSVARPGEVVPYVVLTRNVSDTSAFVVTVSAEWAPELTFVAQPWEGRDPSSATRDRIWWPALAELVGRGAQRDSMFLRAPNAPGSHWVRAIVGSLSPERGTHPNRDSIQLLVTADSLADLRVDIEPVAESFDTVVYEIATWNQGNRTAQRVRLSVDLPRGVDFVRASQGGRGPRWWAPSWSWWRGWAPSWLQRRVTWWPVPPSLAPVPDQGPIIDTLIVVAPRRAGTFVLRADVATPTAESDITNNHDTSSIMVQLTLPCDCPTFPWWLLLLISAFFFVLWLLLRRRRYGRIFAPCFRWWAVFRRKEINGFIAELRQEHNRAEGRIRRIHDRIGGQPCADWAVTVELMYAYRDVRSWTSIYNLYRTCPPALRKKPKMRRLYAFALTRDDRREDAEYVLRKLIEERGPNPHTCGMLGRIYKDRWEEAWSCDRDGKPAEGQLRRAIDTYRQGHESGPDNPYPGVNAMTLSELLPERPEWLEKLSEEVKKAAKEWATEFNYWIHATRAELAVHEEDGEQAASEMDRALSTRHVVWQVETTARNLRLIMEAWGGKQDGAPAWLVSLVDRLEAHVEAARAQAAEGAPGIVPGLGRQGGPDEPAKYD